MLIALLPAGASFPAKPRQGQPCNGCGECRSVEPCAFAITFLRVPDEPFSNGSCPALEFDGGRFHCGLMRHPSRYANVPASADAALGTAIAEMLGAGRGCDTSDRE